MITYEVDLSYYVSLGETEEEYKKAKDIKSEVCHILSSIPNVDDYDVTNDGEDFCINVLATIQSKSEKFDEVDKEIENVFQKIDYTINYHYIKNRNNGEYFYLP